MRKIIYFCIALALLSSCVGKKYDSEETKKSYELALSDSIAIIEQQIDSCTNQIQTLHERTEKWLLDFETVNNPREAGSYMIFKSFRNKYPLTGTGIIARVNSTGQFELVATLSHGNFDQIQIVGDANTVTSDVVPNDQALNYRTEALTTVSFTGEKADEIGKIIADNMLNPLRLNYLNGHLVNSIKLNDETKKMIMATYMLASESIEARRLEARANMLHEKINILRTHKDRE